jgi:hypothetical protein
LLAALREGLPQATAAGRQMVGQSPAPLAASGATPPGGGRLEAGNADQALLAAGAGAGVAPPVDPGVAAPLISVRRDRTFSMAATELGAE